MSNKPILTVLIFGTLIGNTGNIAIAQLNQSDSIQPDIEHITQYEQKGLSMQAPKGWSFMSPSEVRSKSLGAMKIAANAIFFVVNISDFDANINVQYMGDTSRDAPNLEAATRLLTQMQHQVESRMSQQLSVLGKLKPK